LPISNKKIRSGLIISAILVVVLLLYYFTPSVVCGRLVLQEGYKGDRKLISLNGDDINISKVGAIPLRDKVNFCEIVKTQANFFRPLSLHYVVYSEKTERALLESKKILNLSFLKFSYVGKIKVQKPADDYGYEVKVYRIPSALANTVISELPVDKNGKPLYLEVNFDDGLNAYKVAAGDTLFIASKYLAPNTANIPEENIATIEVDSLGDVFKKTSENIYQVMGEGTAFVHIFVMKSNNGANTVDYNKLIRLTTFK